MTSCCSTFPTTVFFRWHQNITVWRSVKRGRCSVDSVGPHGVYIAPQVDCKFVLGDLIPRCYLFWNDEFPLVADESGFSRSVAVYGPYRYGWLVEWHAAGTSTHLAHLATATCAAGRGRLHTCMCNTASGLVSAAHLRDWRQDGIHEREMEVAYTACRWELFCLTMIYVVHIVQMLQ